MRAAASAILRVFMVNLCIGINRKGKMPARDFM
jgi:hypothetical protein